MMYYLYILDKTKKLIKYTIYSQKACFSMSLNITYSQKSFQSWINYLMSLLIIQYVYLIK